MAPSPLPKAVAPMMAAAIIWLRASRFPGSATATGSQRPIKAMPEARSHPPWGDSSRRRALPDYG